jgi:hypothetical protein
MKYVITHPDFEVAGLNPDVYVLDDDDNIIIFDTESEALFFLAKHGVTELEEEGITVKEVSDNYK